MRSVIYRPLAVLLAILLLPSLSWLDSGVGLNSGSSSGPFQASAQIVTGGCHPSQANAIIQNVCPGGLFLAPDLYQLESDAVSAYLAEHNLPATDAHLIYDEGRTDLRSAIRATIFAGLRAIINKSASQRSQHEQTLYTWLQTLVQHNEIAEYTSAINEYQNWQKDPCGFKLDSDIEPSTGYPTTAPFLRPAQPTVRRTTRSREQLFSLVWNEELLWETGADKPGLRDARRTNAA